MLIQQAGRECGGLVQTESPLRFKRVFSLFPHFLSPPQAGGVSVPNVDDPEAFPALAWRPPLHHQSIHQPFRGPPLRGLHAYHIFQVYKKTGRGGSIPNDKKKDSSHTSHTTRGLKFYLILPVLKENKDKKGGKKDLLLHWSFVFRNMKAGMFSLFFFQRLCIFFVCVLLKFMHFCD